jgi:hypothetical protein
MTANRADASTTTSRHQPPRPRSRQHPTRLTTAQLPAPLNHTQSRSLEGDPHHRHPIAQAPRKGVSEIASPVVSVKGTPGRRRLRLGLIRTHHLTPRPNPLRPPQNHRRSPHRRPTQPVQPTPRLPTPLPANPTALQRTDRIPHHPHQLNQRGSLTS